MVQSLHFDSKISNEVWFEPPHVKTNKITCASAQTDQSLLCTQWVAKDPRFPHADSEDWGVWADAQADQMRVYSGLTSLSTIFQSYHDGVWLRQGAQCSLL